MNRLIEGLKYLGMKEDEINDAIFRLNKIIEARVISRMPNTEPELWLENDILTISNEESLAVIEEYIKDISGNLIPLKKDTFLKIIEG